MTWSLRNIGKGRLLSLLTGEGLRSQLLRGGLGSLATKAAGVLLGLAVAVLLARTLGADGYGVYSFALALLTVSAIPAQAGVPQLVVRETARAQVASNYALMRGLWRWATRTVLLFSALALALTGAVALLTGGGGAGARVATLTIGLVLIPLIALTNIHAACLRGLYNVVQGLLPENVIRPAILSVLIAISVFWGIDGGLTPQMAMVLHVIAATLALVLGACLLQRSRPPQLTNRPPPHYEPRTWHQTVVPLALLSGLDVINNQADLLLLGIFHSDKVVGVYRAAFQGAMLVTFGLQAVNQVLQPHFARLYQQGDRQMLQRLATNSARAILAMALLPVALLMGFGAELLAFAFGEPFRAGALAMAILAGGQLVKTAAGSVGLLLNMTGHENDTLRAVAVAVGLNVALNLALIPAFGAEGAAAATMITTVLLNITLWYFVRNRLGIESSAFRITGSTKRTP